ncbi:hypothetical protein Nepgr_008173 [Nepenthes gracilis]|uniref:Uncharacterized protein n=1 Tax=Nepenthes gracilis TaxID=150966 RepID=A0AAD3S874_NEPGR|nr:hypothetical protein Nepgr_008173 [Nepenthes gracilis]
MSFLNGLGDHSMHLQDPAQQVLCLLNRGRGSLHGAEKLKRETDGAAEKILEPLSPLKTVTLSPFCPPPPGNGGNGGGPEDVGLELRGETNEENES